MLFLSTLLTLLTLNFANADIFYYDIPYSNYNKHRVSTYHDPYLGLKYHLNTHTLVYLHPNYFLNRI